MTIILDNPITRWPVSLDETGAAIFGTPQLILGRWEERQQKFLNQKGEECMSRSVVYVDTDCVIHDWIANGDYVTGTPVADPTNPPLPEAYEIRMFTKIPDLRHIEYERKAFM